MHDEDGFLTPDKSSLDEDWVRQPKLYHDKALDLAAAQMEHDEAKRLLELVMAEKDRDVRLEPERYGLPKVTEGSVEKAVVLTPEYQKALKRVNQASHAVKVLAAVVTALDHKKKALENLVQLDGRDYFSKPVAQKDAAGTVMREVESRSRAKILGGGKGG